jgi:rhamnulose-1-phosphate aldolase
MYRLGWDERNGGNLSVLVDESEVGKYIHDTGRTIPLNFKAESLVGKIFILTGTGKYFRNVEGDPENNLGIIRVLEGGETAEVLYGFADGGRPTSETPAHLMSHATRLAIDPLHRVICHCHPTYTLAMNFVHELTDRAFTRTLWKTCTECMVVFPDGIGVLPWMLCGTNEIGVATAKKMEQFRVVIWGMHGIYGAGRDLDEAFGLVETVEKAAQLHMISAHLPQVNTITDDELRVVAKAFGVKHREDFLGEERAETKKESQSVLT